ncbi:MAG: hypothetical protein ACLTDS_12625 [Bianqueaceae bacterium]
MAKSPYRDASCGADKKSRRARRRSGDQDKQREKADQFPISGNPHCFIIPFGFSL